MHRHNPARTIQDDWLLSLLTPQRLLSLSLAWRLALAVLTAVAVTLLLLAVIPATGALDPYHITLTVVILATILLGIGPGLLCLVLTNFTVEAFILGLQATSFTDPPLVRIFVATVTGAFICTLLHVIRVIAFNARRSRERFQALFSNMTQGFALHELITDSQGRPSDYRFLEINPAFEHLTGLKREAILGKRVLEVLPATEPYWIETYGRVVLTGEPMHIENASAPLGRWFEAFAYRAAPGQFAVVFTDITARKQAEALQRTNEQQLRQANELLEAVTLGTEVLIATVDNDLRYTFFNRKHQNEMKRLTGRDTAIGMSLTETLAGMPEERDKALATWRRALQGETVVQTLEFGESGRYRRWYSSRHTPIRDANGSVVGAGEVTADISERIRAQEMLKKSEERLALAASATRVGIVDRNLRTGEISATEQNLRLLGLQKASAGATTTTPLSHRYRYSDWAGCVHPEDLPRVEAEMDRCMAEHAPFESEYRVVWADGSIHWLAARGVFQDNDHGAPLRLLGILMDITERKLIEARERKEHLETAFANRILHVFVEQEDEALFDRALAIVLEGMASQHGVFGYISGPGHLICPSLSKMLDTCEVAGKCIHYPIEKWKGLWARALIEKRSFFTNEAPPVPPGHLPIHNNLAAPILLHGEPIGLLNLANKEGGYSEDDREILDGIATRFAPVLYAWIQRKLREEERKQAEEQLRLAADELKSANIELRRTADELARSNADLEQFAYVASHDLQEPLRMVSGFMNLLNIRYGSQLEGKAAEYMGFAVEGANRMSSLIRDLLTFSQVQSGSMHKEPVDMNAVFAQALDNCSQTILESQARVTADTLPTVLGDRMQLEQLLQNLIANAVKFRREGVAPEVHVNAWHAPLVNEGTGENRDFCFFAVQDNGIGIPPEQAAKIFMIFQRLHTREEYPGTGVGLAICKKIVERHGGGISVEAGPGGGARFIFSIPGGGNSHGQYQHPPDRG